MASSTTPLAWEVAREKKQHASGTNAKPIHKQTFAERSGGPRGGGNRVAFKDSPRDRDQRSGTVAAKPLARAKSASSVASDDTPAIAQRPWKSSHYPSSSQAPSTLSDGIARHEGALEAYEKSLFGHSWQTRCDTQPALLRTRVTLVTS